MSKRLLLSTCQFCMAFPSFAIGSNFKKSPSIGNWDFRSKVKYHIAGNFLSLNFHESPTDMLRKKISQFLISRLGHDL